MYKTSCPDGAIGGVNDLSRYHEMKRLFGIQYFKPEVSDVVIGSVEDQIQNARKTAAEENSEFEAEITRLKKAEKLRARSATMYFQHDPVLGGTNALRSVSSTGSLPSTETYNVKKTVDELGVVDPYVTTQRIQGKLRQRMSRYPVLLDGTNKTFSVPLTKVRSLSTLPREANDMAKTLRRAREENVGEGLGRCVTLVAAPKPLPPISNKERIRQAGDRQPQP